MRRWAVVFGKHASDHVFIDIHSERLVTRPMRSLSRA